MTKWLILVAGVFLFANGMTTRTYSYVDTEKHCFQMVYIGLYGCFGSPSRCLGSDFARRPARATFKGDRQPQVRASVKGSFAITLREIYPLSFIPSA